jgi:DNA-binding MarR family transcriptional regulator
MAPSSPPPSPPDEPAFDLAAFLPYQLSVAANLVSARFAALYAQRFGLTVHEWRIMAALGLRQPATASAICGVTAMDKVQVSRAMAGLLRRGLVVGQPDEADARRILMRFSAEGWQTYGEIVPLAQEFGARLRDSLGTKEAEALSSLLQRLIEAPGT